MEGYDSMNLKLSSAILASGTLRHFYSRLYRRQPPWVGGSAMEFGRERNFVKWFFFFFFFFFF